MKAPFASLLSITKDKDEIFLALLSYCSDVAERFKGTLLQQISPELRVSDPILDIGFSSLCASIKSKLFLTIFLLKECNHYETRDLQIYGNRQEGYLSIARPVFPKSLLADQQLKIIYALYLHNSRFPPHLASCYPCIFNKLNFVA